MTLARYLTLAFAGVIAGASAALAQPSTSFNRQAWLSDYARLKVALAQNYANLDWQVERRGLNLSRADRFIFFALQAAQDNTAATLAMVKLIEAFDDPHLELRAGRPPESASLVPRSSDTDGPAKIANNCDADGYQDGEPATRLPYPSSPDWRPLSEAPFQTGLIGHTGIIRIPAFGEDQYRTTCIKVSKRGLTGRELQLATRHDLNRQLLALIGDLRARGITRLVVDLSRNGGGSEWSSEAVTLFVPGKLRRQEPRLANTKCDRSGVWRGEKAVCSVYGDPEKIETVGPTQADAAWSGPLAIIGDHRTASAAEEFITWARDNGRTAYGGERTAGAGCGYVDGGAAFRFTAVPMYLMIPNCSRYTRDGLNEIEGQTPDLAVDWVTIKPADMSATLDALFAIAPKRRPAR